MKSSTALIMKLLISLMFLSSCSVGMAVSGKEEMNTSVVYPGVPRQAVISRLGEPELSVTDEDGNKIDTYTIVKGNEPSAARAVMHGTLDVITLGLWEVMGTPMEIIEGQESHSQLIIYYDSEDRIKDIQNTNPAITVTTPSLLAPVNEELIQQNNPNIECNFDPLRGYGHEIFFDWEDSDSPNGIKGYRLIVKNSGSTIPVIDEFVPDSEYTDTRCNSFVMDNKLDDWEWTVQAEDNLGNLSHIATGEFIYEPCRMADGTFCSAP